MPIIANRRMGIEVKGERKGGRGAEYGSFKLHSSGGKLER